MKKIRHPATAKKRAAKQTAASLHRSNFSPPSEREMRESAKLLMRQRHAAAAALLSEAEQAEIFRKATHSAHRAAHRNQRTLERAEDRTRERPLDAVPLASGMFIPPPDEAAFEQVTMDRERRQMIDHLAARGFPLKFLIEYDINLDRDPPLGPRLSLPATTPREPLPLKMLEVIADLKTLLRKPAIVALVGSRGRGKTAIAVGLCRWCVEQRRQIPLKVRYTTAKAYVTGCWEGTPEEKSRVRRVHRTDDVVVIDEYQMAGNADRVVDELGELIDCRWRNGLPTILISNLGPAEFATRVGPQIFRRMVDDGLRIHNADWPPLGELLGDSEWS